MEHSVHRSGSGFPFDPTTAPYQTNGLGATSSSLHPSTFVQLDEMVSSSPLGQSFESWTCPTSTLLVHQQHTAPHTNNIELTSMMDACQVQEDELPAASESMNCSPPAVDLEERTTLGGADKVSWKASPTLDVTKLKAT